MCLNSYENYLYEHIRKVWRRRQGGGERDRKRDGWIKEYIPYM